MKSIKILLLFISFSLNFSAHAISDACKVNTNESRSADAFLIDCAAGTTGVPVDSTYSNDMAGTKQQIIDIADGVISFWALLAVWALVWSGIQYTKAYGEDEKLKKAKATWVYSLIGLILLLTAFGLVDIFINFVYTIAGN